MSIYAKQSYLQIKWCTGFRKPQPFPMACALLRVRQGGEGASGVENSSSGMIRSWAAFRVPPRFRTLHCVGADDVRSSLARGGSCVNNISLTLSMYRYDRRPASPSQNILRLWHVDGCNEIFIFLDNIEVKMNLFRLLCAFARSPQHVHRSAHTTRKVWGVTFGISSDSG